MNLQNQARIPFGRVAVTAGIVLALSSGAAVVPQASAAEANQAQGMARLLSADFEEALDEVSATVEEMTMTPGEKVIPVAKKYQGVSYRAGGMSPSGFDCSGFTKYVYGKVGIKLTHNSQAQYNECSAKVAKKDLEPGDLVFFGGSTSSINHVGIYVGDGKYIHSPQTGDVVSIDELSHRTNYVGAARPY